ncbi:MAG: dihydroorotase [Gammaproteobacteria bacterium]|nr:dihydroorotase [Gammaproteobacteria bacterium]MDH3373615.1 dihydroorotase [Gammaproteobacteria bacterium]MDH3409163.1 dihydroorotase [Gammaproteobacteria bacterium]MDH3552989.1 dihydroorotase [Gammaproteobacteria bacterium]
MNKLLVTNARLINEGEIRDADVLIDGERIEKVAPGISATDRMEVVDAGGCYLLPGMIDDQVHFREPGLTAKGDLATESAAAAAGGITSFMDMPNVDPQTTTREALLDKYRIAQDRCSANYGFYLGGTNRNIEEIRKLSVGEACGIKVFMGASTGDMLVDDPEVLEQVFAHAPVIVATHCEHSPTIWENEAHAKQQFGEDVPMSEHPNIRSANACLNSSSMAVDLARRHDALLHVLHLTTAIEMGLFSLAHRSEKRITAEVCVHHLWFDESDYKDHGTRIKCNPAIKSAVDRDALISALNDGRIDIVATDHAPHTAGEKDGTYFNAPSGLPLVQHALLALFDLASSQKIGLELLVDRTSHAPADIFGVKDRGYVREGYFADLVIVDTERPYKVDESNVLYKCGWSPFEGHKFSSTIDTTIVNGQVVYHDGELTGVIAGRRLEFTRGR